MDRAAQEFVQHSGLCISHASLGSHCGKLKICVAIETICHATVTLPVESGAGSDSRVHRAFGATGARPGSALPTCHSLVTKAHWLIGMSCLAISRYSVMRDMPNSRAARVML